MKRIFIGLMVVFMFAPSAGVQTQSSPLTLKLECFEAGPTRSGTFRFTIANNGAEHTSIVMGQLWNRQSWTPAHRLLVKWIGGENVGTYSPGGLGPIRGTAAFTGRIDDIVVPLPPGTSYTTQLDAELFGGQGLRPFTSGFPVPADVSAMLDAKPIFHIGSGQEDLRLVKVWTGKLVSAPIRVPTDCSHVEP